MKHFMHKFLYLTILLAGLSACQIYDASEFKKTLEDLENEVSAMEAATMDMKARLADIQQLIGSRFISYVGKTESGSTVVRYRDGASEEKTVVLVTADKINKLPLVSAALYEGDWYWRMTTDNGATYEWIRSGGQMLKVSQAVPDIQINSDGYWTMNGELVLDKDGHPLLASDASNVLFRSVEQDDATGRVVFTLADGTTFEVATFEALDISFDAAVYTGIPSYSSTVNIKYRVSGSLAKEATVDYFTAWNLDVTINPYSKNIAVKLLSGAQEGSLLIVASAGGNSVVKPLFFTYGECAINKPTWDSKYGVNEITIPGEATHFDMSVSANIDYEVGVNDAAAGWLTHTGTRAPFVSKTLSFSTTEYHNDLGLDREGIITLSNSVYGISVDVHVLQNPVKEQRLENGIATPGDMVLFAKAVNNGDNLNEFMKNGEVVLLKDIDMSLVTSWTPIGKVDIPTSINAVTTSHPFTGVFNGQGHKISGINWTIDAAGIDSDAVGLFGALSGATVKNLTLGNDGDKIVITGDINRIFAAGALVGYAENESKILKVTNNVSIELVGDVAQEKLAIFGGIAGAIRSSRIGDEGQKVYNYGNVGHLNPITNTANGGTGLNTGGIAGYSVGYTTHFMLCYNYGDIWGATGRTGGLIGTIGGPSDGNLVTFVERCYNYGTIEDDKIDQFNENTDCANYKRLGGLVGGTATNAYNKIDACENYGNVFSHIGCRTGGFVGHNRATITSCVNKGIVLSTPTFDLADPTLQSTGPGWACGFCAEGLVTGCAHGGRVGSWALYKSNPSSAPEATMHNAFSYKNEENFDPDKNL